MKSKFFLAALTALLAVRAVADQGFNVFATGGTAVNAGTNYAVIPSQSANGGTPVVTYLSMRGLSTNPITLQSYVTTNQTTITLTNVAGLERTNFVASTNGFAPGQALVIQHLKLQPRFQNEYLLVTTLQNTNQIVFNVPPASPIQVGDIINGETASSIISVATSATAPTSYVGTGILAGQKTEPFLLVISSAGLGTNTIDAVCTQFIP